MPLSKKRKELEQLGVNKSDSEFVADYENTLLKRVDELDLLYKSFNDDEEKINDDGETLEQIRAKIKHIICQIITYTWLIYKTKQNINGFNTSYKLDLDLYDGVSYRDYWDNFLPS